MTCAYRLQIVNLMMMEFNLWERQLLLEIKTKDLCHWHLMIGDFPLFLSFVQFLQAPSRLLQLLNECMKSLQVFNPNYCLSSAYGLIENGWVAWDCRPQILWCSVVIFCTNFFFFRQLMMLKLSQFWWGLLMNFISKDWLLIITLSY
jgi:hypothetical protein